MFSSKSKKSSRTKWSAVLQKRVAVSPVSRVWGTNDLCKIEHHTIHVISCHHSWSKGPAKLHGYIQIQIHVSSSLLPKICWFESSNQLHLVGAVAAWVDAWLGTGPSRQEAELHQVTFTFTTATGTSSYCNNHRKRVRSNHNTVTQLCQTQYFSEKPQWLYRSYCSQLQLRATPPVLDGGTKDLYWQLLHNCIYSHVQIVPFLMPGPSSEKKQSMHRPGPFLLKNGCQGRTCNTAWIRKQLHHSKKDTKNEHPTWEVAPVLTYGSLGLRFNPKITKICKLDEKKISLGPLLFNDPPETV